MTPEERLKEIEECVSTRSGDIEWLIERVKELTEALESMASGGCMECHYEIDAREILTGSSEEKK